jgi:DNA repair protein SbcD/Mre11
MPVKILHFADAHIDIANYGRRDPESGLPQRVVDYLNALDQIIATAIDERVDLVIFAGDAYKDRNPQPTFQRAWGERLMQLSRAGIPTLLLIGNHDIAPAEHRAHTLQEFATLSVPHVHVADTLKLWTPDELGVPVQVLAIPWVTRSRFLARHDLAGLTAIEIMAVITERIRETIEQTLSFQVDPDLPLILTAHASVEGARYGSERTVMLGQDLTLSPGFVSDKRFDYVALGHIHKHQVLNEHPPVVYAGSIERIDFGEAREKKGFILAEVERGEATWEFIGLDTRPFVDLAVTADDPDHFMDDIMAQMPPSDRLNGAVCRVKIDFPQQYEPLLDEKLIRDHFIDAFDFRLVKNRQGENRGRLPVNEGVESLGPIELLEIYWRTRDKDEKEIAELAALASEVLMVNRYQNKTEGPAD